MLETIDKKTGVIRQEYKERDVQEFRKKIEESGYIDKKYAGNRVVRYIVKYKDCVIEARSLTEKTILFSTDKDTMTAFYEDITGE